MCENPPRPNSSTNQWNIRPGMRIWFGGNNVATRRLVTPLLIGTARPTEGPLDAAIITPLTWDEACYFLEKLRPRLVPNGTAWIVEPTATPSIRPAPDANRGTTDFAWFATLAPDPTLLALGYRRPTS